MLLRSWLVLAVLFLVNAGWAAVTSEVSRTDYVGNGSVAAYATTFPVKATTELRVFKQDADGEDVELTLGADYSAVLNTAGLCTITLTAGNLANGYKLSLQRGIPYTQTYNPAQSGAYNAVSLGTALDRLAMEVQRLKGEVDRSIKIPFLEAGGDSVTKLDDNAANRANQAVVFDASGNAMVGGTVGVSASAYAQTILDDTTADAARTTLGLPSQAMGARTIVANDTAGAANGTATLADDLTILADGAASRRDLGARFGDWVNIKDHGAVADGVTDDRAALVSAITKLGLTTGGTVFLPRGNYAVGSAVAVPANIILMGEGEICTTITATGNFTLFTFAGRNALIGLKLAGTGKLGVGLDVGGADFAGQILMDRCRIGGFFTGVKMSGALWTTFRDTVVEGNEVGIDFDAASAAHYSTTVELINMRISSNDRQGVACSDVPVRCQNIAFRGGSIENNGSENPAVYAQCDLSTMAQVALDGLYMEYSIAGAKPVALKLTDISQTSIDRLYVNGSDTGVYSGAAALAYCKISRSRFIATTTNDINIAGGALALGIILEHNEYSATNVLSVSANHLTNITKRYPEWSFEQSSFTPILVGASTPGTPTYGIQQGYYTRIGNMVYIQGRISISALGGLAGSVSIRGLPIVSASTVHAHNLIDVKIDGATVSGGNTQFSALVEPNTSQADLYQQGSTSSILLVEGNLAASTTIIFSGWYTAP